MANSVQFFENQFQRQVKASQFDLNPFERLAVTYLQGEVLDLGCGLGNLAIEAAHRGCSVTAIDASPTAIERIRTAAESGHSELNSSTPLFCMKYFALSSTNVGATVTATNSLPESLVNVRRDFTRLTRYRA